ncbi:MAG TPA: MaoC/PaaZ C-terminal domain-containing protein [Myxococcota bacterium]|nr:MaoC/PaaZ C-terminal domain-containing protein [Myxococcota bacterium]
MRFADVEFGAEMPAFTPDVSAQTVKRFVTAAGMNFPRFWDDEAARKEGLPGAIVPGIMSQGILAALVHRWAPDAKIRHLDTTFRAPVLVGSKPSCKGVVTNLDPATRVVEIDLTLANEAGETRVVSTARVELPS